MLQNSIFGNFGARKSGLGHWGLSIFMQLYENDIIYSQFVEVGHKFRERIKR